MYEVKRLDSQFFKYKAIVSRKNGAIFLFFTLWYAALHNYHKKYTGFIAFSVLSIIFASHSGGGIAEFTKQARRIIAPQEKGLSGEFSELF